MGYFPFGVRRTGSLPQTSWVLTHGYPYVAYLPLLVTLSEVDAP